MRQWLIDAFAARPFKGNPACITEPAEDWPSVGWMQSLAAENNVGATAFLKRTAEPDRFGLRWFTPAMEAPLCGHATLAAAHALLVEMGLSAGLLRFDTHRGALTVARFGGQYELSLPAMPSRLIETPDGLADALGAEPLEVWSGQYVIARLQDAETVRRLAPRLDRVEAISRQLDGQGNLGVAAFGDGSDAADIVDRFFAPGFGLLEDPATGSFHCQLAPIMSDRLGRPELTFHQAHPKRGAEMTSRVEGDWVRLRGAACTVAETRLRIRHADRTGPAAGGAGA